jgi:serine/threonine protein kinase
MTPERYKEVGQLYRAALELEPEQRAAFLAEACGGDEALRQEVASLLGYQGQREGLIDQPALEVAAQALAAEQVRSPVGQSLGHYQILSLLGKGGMGEVYRARDVRLGREVAIKILPAEYSADADRLRRFEQEARAASRLNHPNVLTIYDIGTHAGAPYLVAELLEGETLRGRLKGADLPLRRAIDYALQVARGLQAAHAKGIVHRDLKPENLFVTKDGRVKILDFGLAKLKPPPAGIDTNASTQPLSTASGMVMGTPHYMSPEQVRAEEVDHRADIFAFGAILYEMLSGRRAFQGNSVVEVMNAILKEEPAGLAESGREAPPALERALRHCLEKSPAERFQTIGDVAFYLETLAGIADKTLASQARAAGQKSYESLGWIVVAVLLLVAVALLIYFRRTPAEVEAIHFSIPPPEKTTGFSNPVISPDGRHLAFTAAAEGKGELLWVRALGSLAARPLAGTEGASFPFWSPTGEFLGFFAQGKLKKIALSGGLPTTLCEAPNGRGGAWSRDDVILFVPNRNTEVHRVSAAGGSAVAVTRLDKSRGEISHRWPSFLPDGRHFLYGVREIYLASLDGGEAKHLVSAESNVVYAPPGYLLFLREGTLLAQPFDADKRQLTGKPFRIADQVQGHVFGKGHFSVSENGVLVYSPSAGGGNQQLGWFDRAGKRLGLIGSVGNSLNPRLSPDDKQVAVVRYDLQTKKLNVWLLDLSRGTDSPFTFIPGSNIYPVWSPDGSRLVWTSGFSLYQKASSGAGQEEPLFTSGSRTVAWDWSGDGRFIIYETYDPHGKLDLWVLPLHDQSQAYAWQQTQSNETSARFSPDSKWIAYTSDESGSNEVYVQAFQAFQPASGKRRISTGGGDYPRFGRDGKELFYLAADGKLMAVEVRSGASFEFSAPRPLFDLQSIRGIRVRYDVTRDGQRFLIVTESEATTAEPFTVVLNWTAAVEAVIKSRPDLRARKRPAALKVLPTTVVWGCGCI